jgi:hypothetical protein
MASRIPSARFSTSENKSKLGLLHELAGEWKGGGFNLIARPNFHDKQNLYLQLNQTTEKLVFTPIGGPVPNRGFGQDDIELFGLTYLQQISDAGHDGALHIEPGIWITQPKTNFPNQDPPPKGQLVARMATIPHGNAVLAEGIATPFTGTPTLSKGTIPYDGSAFPSFNSTPFAVPPTAPVIVFNAAGSSEKLTAPTIPGPPPPVPFDEYDLAVAASATNPRTPFDTSPAEPALPASIDGVPMQEVINDPILLLQARVNRLLDDGWEFGDGVVLNVSTTRPLTFLAAANTGPTGATAPPVNLPQFGGGSENIQFLIGETKVVATQNEFLENAQTAIVYSTFWIERLTHKKTGQTFMQLQYAQMVVLNFPIFLALNPPPTTPPTPSRYVNLGWPHITVGTLRRNFG